MARNHWIGILLCAVALALGTAVAVEAPTDKGIGKITSIKLAPLDPTLAAKGKTTFEQKCSACHKSDERYVGPALKGVTQRRTPEWIMNMVLDPQGMTTENTAAQQLLGEYMVQMTFQNVSEDDARAILEFLRENDAVK